MAKGHRSQIKRERNAQKDGGYQKVKLCFWYFIYIINAPVVAQNCVWREPDFGKQLFQLPDISKPK